ncbi:MAG: hypothetical protein WAO83_18765 [Fuerstiella sp.]
MSSKFWNEFAKRAETIEQALLNRDASVLSKLADDLQQQLWDVDKRLNINVSGPEPFQLGILPLPGAESAAGKFVSGQQAPRHWEVVVGLPELDDLESVLIQDDLGDTLEVQYSDVEVKVLPPTERGVSIVLSLLEDFDPEGSRKHLYQAAADNIVNTLLGGFPPELAQVLILPRSVTGRFSPAETLRQQWLDVTQQSRKS